MIGYYLYGQIDITFGIALGGVQAVGEILGGLIAQKLA
jgi:hypothetical protein